MSIKSISLSSSDIRNARTLMKGFHSNETDARKTAALLKIMSEKNVIRGTASKPLKFDKIGISHTQMRLYERNFQKRKDISIE